MNFGKNVVDKIVELLPPPLKPDRCKGKLTDPRVGPSIPLPEDYLEFMEIYGPGRIMAQFENGVPHLHWMVQICDASNFGFDTSHFNALHFYEPETHLPSYPELPGVLIWGFREQGFSMYWEIANHFQPWTMSIDAKGEAHERYPCTFAEFFLYNILQQESSIEFNSFLIFSASHIGYQPESVHNNTKQYFAEHPELVVEFPIKPKK